MSNYRHILPRISYQCPINGTWFENYADRCYDCEYFVEKDKMGIWCKYPKTFPETIDKHKKR